MFPFHRKHGNNHNTNKQQGRHRHSHRNSEDTEMSDEEYLEYIHRNDTSRNQLTSGAHDRYCHKLIREKEDILLSALNPKELEQSAADNSFRLGPSTSNNIFLNLLPAVNNKYYESVSMPSSPVDSRNFLHAENIARRNSDSMAHARNLPTESAADQKSESEYILTLKIDDLASNVEDISFYRIGPKPPHPQQCTSMQKNVGKYELTESLTDISQIQGNNLDSANSPSKKINHNFVQYREITAQTCVELQKLLIGSMNHNFFSQWFRQCFSFSHIPTSRWQLVQVKSGSCGVIAAVEAFIIKCLLFKPGFCKFKEPLRPNQKEIVDAFISALAHILWQVGDFQKSVLFIPKNADGMESIEFSSKEVISESCAYVEYFNFESLKEAVAINMKYFTCPPYHGYLNFIMSAMLSRGSDRILEDMDEEVTLITENGHCSLELVMLLITGRAVSNVFDYDIQIDSCLLKGVKKQSDIGFLSLFEYMNTCEVGSFLKLPKYPIWLVNCADHFTVLFSNKLEHAKQDIQQPFVLYHYDSMTAFSCESDVKLVIGEILFDKNNVIFHLAYFIIKNVRLSIRCLRVIADTQSNYADDQFEKDQSHLQLCIKTKWKNATVIYTENSELYLV